MTWLGAILGLALFQALMVIRNLGLYSVPAPAEREFDEGLSVLIPARNEEENVERLLRSLMEQKECLFEVIVLDDDSTDNTASVVREFSRQDSRVSLLSGPTLPAGWAGKQHACHLLAGKARYDYWLYLDADVVLTDPQALARIGHHLHQSPSALLSSVPRQITETWAEQMVIPLIHLVLLGFLPFWEMRRNRMPALGAACGQLVAIKRWPYQESGGHLAVKHRLHDATALAANFRRHGYLTDLFDSTPLARCRMYRSPAEVFRGFAKNATEGMAQPQVLPLWTALLLGANVLPWAGVAWWGLQPALLAAQALNLFVYVSLMRRYRQNLLGALTRPAGVLIFVAIQWLALVGKWVGWKATWKGRSYERLYT